MKLTWKPNAILKLGRESGIDKKLHEEAVKVMREAQRLAPVDTGAYRDSIHVVQSKAKRGGYLVVSDDWKVFLVESKHGTLKKALRVL